MRIKSRISYSQKLMIKCYFQGYMTQCRACCGISTWNEEITCATKHAVEKYWRDKLPVSSCQNETKPKFYVLSMFPYPSGQLHMGHVRVYTISDVMARFYRMNGKNVIHPMGWDGFGLPAENAARDHGIEPSKWTSDNIKRMKDQLLHLGCSFDWDRELSTCDPLYYKWTQSVFLRLHSRGLVYQKEALVNWDPVDETVLADEQVDDKGRSWRSGAKVEKRLLNQWFIRTTKFARLLLEGLDDPELQDWRDIIKLQRHWIGSCEGITLDFKLDLVNEENPDISRVVTVWTKNPELVYGARFIAISPESSINLICKEDGAKEITKDDDRNLQWKILPCSAVHPLTKENLPVVVLYPSLIKNSEGMLVEVSGFQQGTDCRLGLPSESELDHEIAITSGFTSHPKMVDENSGTMLPSAGPLSGLPVSVARASICKEAASLNVGGYPVGPSLKDWLISRQRYWGTPIPMIHCEKCGAVPVPEKDLPVVLPPPDSLLSVGGASNKVSTLDKNKHWKETLCPSCGGKADRETDTMDTFVDSSWYFLRYLDPKNASAPFSTEKVKHLMPVDLYIGGKEHAVLHLYYARFMSYFFHSEGLIPKPEPFKRLLVQGMIMGKTYRIKSSGKYLRPSEVKIDGKKVFEKDTNQPVSVSWEKMSKSKYNGVEPSDMIEEHGVDTTRLLVLADVSPTSHRKWSPQTFPGIINWQRRLWITMREFRELRSSGKQLPRKDDFEKEDLLLWDSRNFYLKGASFNYGVSYQLSIAISKMQGLTNSLRKASPAVVQQSPNYERALATQLILLAPMAPHFASELWSGLVTAPGRVNVESEEIDWEKNVLEQKWPEVDLDYQLDLLCLMNGKERCRVKIPRRTLDELKAEQALEICLSHPSYSTISRTPRGIAGEDERKRCMVDFTYTLYPSYQALINVLTEAGVNPLELESMVKEEAVEFPKEKQRA